jgi:hypothetical protein
MIQPSARYSAHLLYLLAPALLAVAAHRYVGLDHDDCAEPQKLMTFGESSRLNALRDTFSMFQGNEGPLTGMQGRFAIVRSYDLKRLYHHPELVLLHGSAIDGVEVEWATDGAESLPVHRVHFEKRDPPRYAGYLLIHGSRVIAKPYQAHLAALPIQFLTGARPMTLAFISAEPSPGHEKTFELSARAWLMDFWRKYKTECRC